MQIEYAAVIIVFYLACALMLLHLIYKFGIKGNSTITLLAGVCFFATLVHRNFKVFFISRMTFTEDVMVSNYLGSVLAVFFIYGLWRWFKG
jgi:VanZ family protein